MARISEARAREYLFRTAKSGSFSRIFCMVGIRKPRVFPVPVRACAILDTVSLHSQSVGRYYLHI